MELPTSVADDIEQNEDISRVVKVNAIYEGNNVRERVLLTDINGNDVQLTLFDQSPEYDLVENQWYLFQSASGNIYQGQKELRPNFGDLSIEPIDPPKDLLSNVEENENESSTADGADGNLALDIETIQTVEEGELDLDNPNHLELLCIGVGYQPSSDGPIETDVLFREGSSTAAELDLIESLCDWLETREATTLLTYNGEFDLGHIQARAELASQATKQRDGKTVQRVEKLFSQLTHNDLKRPGLSLETVADVPETYWDIYNHNIDPTDWRRTQKELGNFDEDRPLDDPVISGSDIPYFGQEFLTSTKGSPKYRALYEMIYRYAISDVEPLFDL
ncbi:hypothetical protein [Halopiger djelfimassiliensis]|uniref:hypothetical protein n=1 Tax=Halopiger djelfimassiliensis TaxID=1293047 RepID=UPI0012B60F3C|nr:hypothetical protein [Halopiger djelfimassiliensis]